jgi:hypothetical protein
MLSLSHSYVKQIKEVCYYRYMVWQLNERGMLFILHGNALPIKESCHLYAMIMDINEGSMSSSILSYGILPSRVVDGI